MVRRVSKGVVWFVCLLGISFNLLADKNRYVVFFSDKEESVYSADEPLGFLSQKAIDRRTKVGVSITSQDFPVNQNYLDSLVAYGVTPFFTSRWLNAVLVESEAEILEELLHQTDYVTGYEYVAPGTRLNTIREPYEEEFEGFEPAIISSNSSVQLRMLGVDMMHDLGYTGKGIHIAVFDAGFSGVNESAVFSHIFENERLVDQLDFTRNSEDVFAMDDHGTSVLSCIAANHEEVLVGAGYEADVSLYITEDASNGGAFEYRIEEYNWLFAAERADSCGVDIISSSLGYNLFEDASMSYSYEDTDGETAIVSQAASIASQKGILVVNSAGNDGNSSWKYIAMPSDVTSVLTVGAINSSYMKSSFSSFGPTTDGRLKPDVVALGEGVSVLSDENVIGTNRGTSFSTPLISGMAAGIWQQFPDLSNQELKDLMLLISDNYANPNSNVGYGLPNYSKLTVDSLLSVGEIFEEGFVVFPNPFSGDHIYIRISKEYSKRDLELQLYAPDGKLIRDEYWKRKRKEELLELKVDNQSKGIYILHLRSGKDYKNIKLLRY